MLGYIPAILLATQLSAGERLPIVAVVLTPPNVATTFTVTEVREALVRVVRRATPFRVLAIDPALERCVGSLSCIVANLKEVMATDAAPRLVVVVSQRPDKRLIASVFNLPRAAEVLAKSPAELRPGDDVDSEIYDRALVTEAPPTLLTDVGALEAHLATLVARAWSTSSEFEPCGTIVVRTSTAPLVVELDGRSLGVSTSTTIVVADVRPGVRRVGLGGASGTTASAEVVVESGLTVQADIPIAVPSRFRFPHQAVWPVAGLVGAGVLLVAIGADRASGLTAACLSSGEGECGGNAGFARLLPGESAGTGPLAVPLGYSLILAGVAYIATYLTEGEDTPWWVAPLVAVGVSALTYTISEVAVSPVE